MMYQLSKQRMIHNANKQSNQQIKVQNRYKLVENMTSFKKSNSNSVRKAQIHTLIY